MQYPNFLATVLFNVFFSGSLITSISFDSDKSFRFCCLLGPAFIIWKYSTKICAMFNKRKWNKCGFLLKASSTHVAFSLCVLKIYNHCFCHLNLAMIFFCLWNWEDLFLSINSNLQARLRPSILGTFLPGEGFGGISLHVLHCSHHSCQESNPYANSERVFSQTSGLSCFPRKFEITTQKAVHALFSTTLMCTVKPSSLISSRICGPSKDYCS